jgi:uncharacterized protein YqeY
MLWKRFVKEPLTQSRLLSAIQKRKLSSGVINAGGERKNRAVMLRDKLKADSVVALKNHDSRRVEILRFLVSLIDKRAMQLPPEGMTEAEELAVLRKELKNKEESREMFVTGNREDLVKEVDVEIAVVKEYLPVDMDEETIAKMVDEVVAKVGKANFGMIMGMVMKQVAGKASGDVVSKIVKEKLV